MHKDFGHHTTDHVADHMTDHMTHLEDAEVVVHTLREVDD